MKFKKKPVVIEAVQYVNGKFTENPSWLEAAMRTGVIIAADGMLFVRTLEGDMRIEEGAWVIQGVKGELYPCKGDIFLTTYERAT